MSTLAELEAHTGIRVLDHLDREAEVPVVTRAACQGDVSMLRVTTTHGGVPVPRGGVPVVRGEVGGHTHLLVGTGGVRWEPAGRGGDDLALGFVTVPAGADAFLLHEEHGGMQLAPGTYRIGRQREFAGEWRAVAD